MSPVCNYRIRFKNYRDGFKIVNILVFTYNMSNTPERISLLIEADIASGELAPGFAINEKELAQRFGVSRTPIREALLMLAARKLVINQPRVGTLVYKPDPAELIALLEYLGELEGAAARLSAQRMSAAQRNRLRAIHEASIAHAQNQDRPAYELANLELHQLIYAGSGNPVIREEIEETRLKLTNFRRNVFEQPGRLQISCSEHIPLVNAICAGDGEGAAQAMRDHIIGKGRAFADLVLTS